MRRRRWKSDANRTYDRQDPYRPCRRAPPSFASRSRSAARLLQPRNEWGGPSWSLLRADRSRAWRILLVPGLVRRLQRPDETRVAHDRREPARPALLLPDGACLGHFGGRNDPPVLRDLKIDRARASVQRQTRSG